MQWLTLLASALAGMATVDAKAVVAHFMMVNADYYAVSDWQTDIADAQAAKIDGFALNFAADQADRLANQVANAFQAANAAGFKLMFSFDYAGAGAWDSSKVISYLKQYGGNSAHLQYNGKPVVNTFEGPQSSGDWPNIKSQTGCFFMPEWDSIGPSQAATTSNSVADGLFSWTAWPNGANDMGTGNDQAYKSALGGKPYMMAVSPWFYTNVPGFNKNWLWRGDDLWFDRWSQVQALQPELVQIVTWNDWPESSYISPLRGDKSYSAFSAGNANYNYALDMPHDGWRTLLPYRIDMYKNNAATITSEAASFWYRTNPKDSCNTGGTLANAPWQSQLQPSQVVQDKVFFTALLSSAADVSVTIGGQTQNGTWTKTPANGGAGLYHGSANFNGRTGAVSIIISRKGTTVLQQTGKTISTSCTNGNSNWNAWVGSVTGRTLPNAVRVDASGSSTTIGAVASTTVPATSSTTAPAISTTASSSLTSSATSSPTTPASTTRVSTTANTATTVTATVTVTASATATSTVTTTVAPTSNASTSAKSTATYTMQGTCTCKCEL
ncbi:unnamed protein product [Zymoseptoria tritici ST99CH_1A5]|uniref:Uncharacterized protein n=1 Tax=Zymoseptoria tritici ST99CH_1A5 TaxID=1276529 RepID=A0A1Y6LYT4_ZYMTR|nr:unnamed protein product [Zymoseptoria tritici ST99CH_1A5]